MDSWCRITSAMMKLRNFSAKAGSSLAFSARAQPFDLPGLAGRVGGRELVPRLEPADLLGALEALGEHVDDGRVDVVDAVAQPLQLLADRGVDVTGTGVADGHGGQP